MSYHCSIHLFVDWLVGDIWWESAPCNFNTCYNTAGRQWKNLSNPDTDLSLDYDFYYKSEGNSELVLNLKATQTGIFRCIRPAAIH
jgi:hypothetical protein